MENENVGLITSSLFSILILDNSNKTGFEQLQVEEDITK